VGNLLILSFGNKMAVIEKRLNKNREISYRVKIRLKGYPPQNATFERLTDARRWAQQTESALREGRYFKHSEAKRRTFAEAADRYIKTVLPRKPKSYAKQRSQLEWWKDQIGSYLLADVTPSILAEHRDKLSLEKTVRGKLRSPSTVNRYLAIVSHLFTMAVKEWGWIESNPLLKLSKPKEPRGRIRFLDDEERNRLLKACKESDSKFLYLVVVLALSTGARKMEILSLYWKDIDFERQVIILHETKNGDRRILPLAGQALKLLQSHAVQFNINQNDLVFPAKNPANPIDLRTPWENALKRSGIKEFRFHDLRHSAASYIAMNNGTLAEIAEILGHKTLQMVKRYAHLSDSHVSKVIERMNGKIFEMEM
jgi:integrase